MGEKHLKLLVYIAKKTNLHDCLETSTIKIAKDLKSSQQTISRKLKEMESLELIKKDVGLYGVTISLRRKSVNLLHTYYRQLKDLFDIPLIIEGRAVSGHGEGEYYVKKYSSLIKQKMGFVPFNGTLNIKVDELKTKNILSSLDVIKIDAFKTKDRTYGAVNCFNVRINNAQEGAIVVPERSSHPNDVVEVIAPVNLRKMFRLKSNSKLKIYIDNEQKNRGG